MATTATQEARQARDYVRVYNPPAIDGNFVGKHIITVDQFTSADLQIIFDAAASLKKRSRQNDRGLVEVCSGRVMATLFYEASTRTDMSFQTAMRRLGGEVVAASNGVQFSSVYKGENLADTVRAAGCYADVIVLRHPDVGSTYEAAYYLDMLSSKIGRQPVIISGGDGVGEHPTQALLDMFTIIDFKKSLDNLTITMVGDLKHGRTVHSLAKLIARLQGNNVTVNFVAPPSLMMPPDIIQRMRDKGVSVNETDNLSDVLSDSDVIYWTRVQEERFADRAEYEAIKDGFVITPPVLEPAKPDAILMHPLPRKHEMGTPDDHDLLDADSRSVYFQLMENGMFVRMALLTKVLRGVYV